MVSYTNQMVVLNSEQTGAKSENNLENVLLVWTQKFPDLRFACPNCGSLDVLVKKDSENFMAHCLDCNKKWNQEKNDE